MKKTMIMRSLSFAINYKPYICNRIPKRNFSDGYKSTPLKLMNFPQVIWPTLSKSVKNYIFAILIRANYEPTFTLQSFLKGSEKAIIKVSSILSRGDFASLEGLVTTEAIKEIEGNYDRLSQPQKESLEINPDDIFLKTIHEVGMIMNNDGEKNFVEITTVLQGFHGLKDVREGSITEISTSMMARPQDIYVCNYRFSKELTKEDDDSTWIINKLNHFNPK